MSNQTQDISRRSFCVRSATCLMGAAIVLTMGPQLARAQAKMTQQQVNYQPTPKGAQRCDTCTLFQAPKACKSVSGDISPVGWCVIYKAKS